MKYINNNLYKDNKSSLCIGIDVLNISNLPKIIKKYISDALINGERVIFFIDDIFYKDIGKSFNGYEDLIRNNVDKGNFKIKTYNSETFNYNCKEFLEFIHIISEFKEKLKIVCDFKNLINKVGKLEVVIKCVEKIMQCSKNNASSMVYIDNDIYNFKRLYAFSNLFEKLIIIDRNKEMEFVNKDEMEKAIWMLQSNSQLKYENKNLVLFNDISSSIPKDSDENEFKKIIMGKIKDVYDVDFCALHSSLKEQENTTAMDSYYGISKKHKHYLSNDTEVIQYINKSNKIVLASNEHILFNLSEIKDVKLIDKFKLMGIVSYVAIAVEYYNIAKGVMWLGRYENNRELSKDNIEYLKSICNTAFYLIQEQKRFSDMQNKLIQNEKLRAMGEMAAGITHDVNNILTPILGSVQLLKDTIKERENLKLLNVIEICAYDGMNITNKVKRLTKKYNSDDFEVFSIDNVISDAIDLTRSKWLTESIFKGIKINIIKSLESNEAVQGNITEIREVFINIITNAIDAMPKGGKIEIITKNKDNMVIIEIRDNGMGMERDIKKRILEPFFTTKGDNGSGLGLSISYNIVLSHKGSMKVESEKGVGTSFIVKLPICKSVVKSIDQTSSSVTDSIGNVLVIDDQEQVRNIVSSMISSITKCKIKACGCDNLDSELTRRRYDVVVCDFTMPSINGLQVAQKVKDLNKQTYFCLMTGWMGSFKGEDMNNVDFILNKPINKESLKQMVIDYNEKVLQIQ